MKIDSNTDQKFLKKEKRTTCIHLVPGGSQQETCFHCMTSVSTSEALPFGVMNRKSQI